MNIGVHRFFWVGVSGFLGYDTNDTNTNTITINNNNVKNARKHQSTSKLYFGVSVGITGISFELNLFLTFFLGVQ